MNHDFDDELERSPERRSRKNPKLQGDMSRQDSRMDADFDAGDGTRQTGEPGRGSSEREKWESRRRVVDPEPERDLDVLGDSSVHPISRQQREQQRQTANGQTYGHAQSRREGARQTAAASSGGGGNVGLPRHIEEQIASRKRRRRIITMIVAECFVLLFIFSYAFFAKKWNMIQRPQFDEGNVKNNNLNMDTMEKMKGYWTIAIFGVDARDKAISKGTNSDVNIICNVNLDSGEIKMVSVFRDTYLNISDKGAYNKINQAYFLGGPEQAVSALNQNLDLSIVSYMTFNWKAVADAINILGGVDIELSKAEFYYINSFITETVKATGVGSHQLSHAGMNHLDGVQAVAYGRLRLMDTDYARTERQRKVIAQTFEKAKKADLATLNTVIGTVFPQIVTNIGVDDLVKNASVISKFKLGESTGFPQARGDASMGKKGLVVVPQTLTSNVVQLHKFLFGDEAYSPSSKVKSISEKIAADTGMYREGKYVDHVTTEGGVIQPPKTTAAPKKEDTKDDEDEAEYVYETDEDGNYVYETDSDGDYVYETNANGKKVKKKVKVKKETAKETDEDGNPVKETTVQGKPGTTTEAETDEYGNPVETVKPTRPGSTLESSEGGLRPGETESSAHAVRPGDETEPSTVDRPGGQTEPTTTPRPGGETEATHAVRPGDETEPSTVDRPGGQTPPGATPTTGSSDNGPTGNGGTASVPNFPGGSEDTVGSQGPGGEESGVLPGGPISAPGQ